MSSALVKRTFTEEEVQEIKRLLHLVEKGYLEVEEYEVEGTKIVEESSWFGLIKVQKEIPIQVPYQSGVYVKGKPEEFWSTTFENYMHCLPTGKNYSRKSKYYKAIEELSELLEEDYTVYLSEVHLKGLEILKTLEGGAEK